MSATVTLQRTSKPKPVPAEVKTFGTIFTDHMFVMPYDQGKGWHDPKIIPYSDFQMDPATSMLHYGQAIFDGLKGFRDAKGEIRLFRPKTHAARINRSSERLCIPAIPEDVILDSFLRIVDVDRQWVPKQRGTAVYIRPTIVATDAFLGVRPAHSYIYFVILSPVGPYYAEGFDPVSILVEDTFVRASAGGLGAAKTPANYAASLLAAEHAKKKGYTQVLWLDGVERKWLEEVGTMNIMLKIDGEVITPPLSDSILAGVTRDTTLALLREWGHRVSERRVSIDEVIGAARNGKLEEMWGTGTAAVISPVGELGYKGDRIRIKDGKTGPLTQKLYDTITAVQYGEAPDPHNWMVAVPKFN